MVNSALSFLNQAVGKSTTTVKAIFCSGLVKSQKPDSYPAKVFEGAASDPSFRLRFPGPTSCDFNCKLDQVEWGAMVGWTMGRCSR